MSIRYFYALLASRVSLARLCSSFQPFILLNNVSLSLMKLAMGILLLET